MNEQLMSSLARIEQSIRASDGEAILARWDFGAEVLEQRVGEKLPIGLLAEIRNDIGISQQELSKRVRVAEHYDRQGLTPQGVNHGKLWTELVKALPKKRKPGTRSPKPPSLGPTTATIAEAERVKVLIAKPDVAAELRRQAATDATAAKAAAMIERRERAEAKAQKEQDREAQEIAKALRLRLVEGGTDWGNLTDQVETIADTGRRLCRLLDGLPYPDPVWAKQFDRHLAAAQEALYELRRRVVPSHDEASTEVWSTSVIESVAR